MLSLAGDAAMRGLPMGKKALPGSLPYSTDFTRRSALDLQTKKRVDAHQIFALKMLFASIALWTRNYSSLSLVPVSAHNARMRQIYYRTEARLSFVGSTSQICCPYTLRNIQNLGAVPPYTECSRERHFYIRLASYGGLLYCTF